MSSYMEHNLNTMDTHGCVRAHLFAHIDTRGWR